MTQHLAYDGKTLVIAHFQGAICGIVGQQGDALMVCGVPFAGGFIVNHEDADVALVDLTLGDESGLDLIDDLLANNVAVVIYSMHEDRKTVEKAFVAGAAGYVTKREVADVLLTALDQVLAGNHYASPRATKSLANRFLVPHEDMQAALSSREEQIVSMIGRAETSEEIAVTLHISIHTVKTYYARIIEKLGIAGMKELRKYAAMRNK